MRTSERREVQRQALAAVRGNVTRLQGPQAPIYGSPLDRLQIMSQHWAAIEADARRGLSPADSHLTALAAHLVLWHMDNAHVR